MINQIIQINQINQNSPSSSEESVARDAVGPPPRSRHPRPAVAPQSTATRAHHTRINPAAAPPRPPSIPSFAHSCPLPFRALDPHLAPPVAGARRLSAHTFPARVPTLGSRCAASPPPCRLARLRSSPRSLGRIGSAGPPAAVGPPPSVRVPLLASAAGVGASTFGVRLRRRRAASLGSARRLARSVASAQLGPRQRRPRPPSGSRFAPPRLRSALRLSLCGSAAAAPPRSAPLVASLARSPRRGLALGSGWARALR
jgi:hypothetical protein